MRLLAIRGARLASLHDPFEIDFDRPPLAGAGLFAITGPTGAGKSTLLDAVCLALYGDAPRVRGIGGADIALGLDAPDRDQRLGARDPRHLLSRGSRRGHAEVDFLAGDGARYRARWSVEPRPRAGDLADADMSLVRLGDGQVVATGLKATRREVERLGGFTFEEFQKAVLLPQGQFAEFLAASARDRADLLEKVAGGELYGVLGKLAAARQAREAAALERLEAEAAAHHPLTGEARAAATAARDGAAAEVAAARGGAVAARDALAWHDRAAELEAGAAAAAEALAGAAAARDAALPRRAELAEVERALLEREPLAAALRAEAALAAAREERDRRSAAAAEVAGRAAGARRALADAEAARAAVEAEASRTRPELEAAHRLEAELGAARRGLEESDRAARASAAEAEAALERATAAAEGRRRQERARDEARGWLAAREGEGATVPEWPRWRDLIVRHGRARAAAAAARKRRDETPTPEAVAQARAQAENAAAERARTREAAAAAAAARSAAEVTRREAEGRAALARAALQRARDAQRLEARRAELEEGQPCPLCGATEHPWAGQAEVDALVALADGAARGCEAALAAAGAELERTRAAAEEAGRAAAAAASGAEEVARAAERLGNALARAGQEAAEAALARAEADAAECEAALAPPFARLPGWGEALAARPAALLAEGDARAAAHAERRRALEAAEQALAAAGPALAGAEAEARERAAAAAAAGERLRSARAEVERLRGARAERLGGRPAGEVEAWLAERRRDAERALDGARAAAGTADAAAAAVAAREEEAAARATAAGEEAGAAAVALAAALARLGTDRAALQRRVALGDRFVAPERRALDALDEAERRARALLEERRRSAASHAATRPGLDRAAAAAALAAATAADREADARRIEAEATLRADATAREALDALGPRLAAQRTRAGLAAQLGELIGQGGNRSFRAFAQGLALDALLVHANRHLEALAPRYRLARVPGQDMELQALDLDLGGAARGVNSLSGGETFLVSLGLALGLSGLATRAARVESLFVDEGFGTLDPEALDQAMSVLEGLRATGRTVGIISHVPELHERIGVLVQVEKIGAGRSRVRAVRLGEAGPAG